MAIAIGLVGYIVGSNLIGAPLSGGPDGTLRTGDDGDPGSTLHELTYGRARGFALADGGGHLGGAVGALLLPTLTGATFLLGFAVIGITGLLVGLIALGGPKTSGRSREKVTQ